MEVDFPRYGKGLDLAFVVKRLRDKYGIPIGTANDNPLLDSRIYEAEHPDGHRASFSDNAISENLFAQVNDEHHCSVLVQ